MTHRTGSSVWTSCPACDGKGYCHNEYHDFDHHALDFLPGEVEPCPACGKVGMERGNCSVCGGDGH